MSFRVPRVKTRRDLVYQVTAEMSKKRGDKMSFGVPPMKIPRDLYDLIMKAVSLRKHLEANPYDESAINKVLGAEYIIPIVANHCKGKDLPRRWEYVF
ncbi:uncharacterized protein [Rutidosis leptorrhynchoides]|uniref:uncharacterized protein isoform X2 n=1 Tax=Rutidosis leptorrhynchoides TaxID=125765 RepID=UPI003A9989A5